MASGLKHLSEGSLTPGTYASSAFRPSVTFTIGDGWEALFADDDDELAIEHTPTVLFYMTRVTQVIDPTKGVAAPVPDDLVQWLARHPDLNAEAPKSVTLAGLPARTVVVHTNGQEVATFYYTTGNMRVPAGFTAQYYVLPMDGPDLTVKVGAPTKQWAAALALTAPILESLRVAPAS